MKNIFTLLGPIAGLILTQTVFVIFLISGPGGHLLIIALIGYVLLTLACVGIVLKAGKNTAPGPLRWICFYISLLFLFGLVHASIGFIREVYLELDYPKLIVLIYIAGATPFLVHMATGRLKALVEFCAKLYVLIGAFIVVFTLGILIEFPDIAYDHIVSPLEPQLFNDFLIIDIIALLILMLLIVGRHYVVGADHRDASGGQWTGSFPVAKLISLVAVLGMALVFHGLVISLSLHLKFFFLQSIGKEIHLVKAGEEYLARSDELLGEEHYLSIIAASFLADEYHKLRAYKDAEKLYLRVLNSRKQELDNNDPATLLVALSDLVIHYTDRGDYIKAEKYSDRHLDAIRNGLSVSPDDKGFALSLLSDIRHYQGRHRDALRLIVRAQLYFKQAGQTRNIFLDLLAPKSPADITQLEKKGDLVGAERALKANLLNSAQRWGQHHPNLGNHLTALSSFHERHKNYVKSLGYLRLELALLISNGAPDRTEAGEVHKRIADVLKSSGDLIAAAAAYEKALKIYRSTYSESHYKTIYLLYDLSDIYHQQKQHREAYRYLTIADNALNKRRAVLGSMVLENFSDGLETIISSRLIDVAWSLLSGKAPDRYSLVDVAYRSAQKLDHSVAGRAVMQMGARMAADNSDLAKEIRERQDLVNRWVEVEKQSQALLIRSDQSGAAKPGATFRAEELELTRQIELHDEKFKQDFSEFSDLSRPKVLPLAETYQLLADDEALVFFASGGRHLWVVTHTKTHMVNIGANYSSIKQDVMALRCGLDRSNWSGAATECARLLDLDLGYAPQEDDLLPFDLARAHKLYEKLFGKVKEGFKDKHLLIVPSGPLTQLPFQVLVTEKPDTNVEGLEAYQSASWLANDHAITMLPSVSSLLTLRRDAKASKASRTLIGFGNPLLDGGNGEAHTARAAREITGCAMAKSFETAQLRGVRRGVNPLGRGAELTSLEAIRAQSPLPETADELCRVARSANADIKNDIHLGARATEARLKDLNENGTLSRYKVLHFATHGTMAGELKGANEPGLILTPPKKATQKDDGYLSVSEIAGLKLDADWVILSACNTAGGGSGSAEALSGIARAFFYAGTRALLVSHWYVNSNASVALITKTFNVLREDTGLGRAQALQRAMLELINSGTPMAHPEYWAPFVVVGEGAGTG